MHNNQPTDVKKELEHRLRDIHPEKTWVEIVRQMKFASAHQLPYQGFKEGAGKGKCTRLHGHTYVIEIGVKGPIQPVHQENPESGMVVDFGLIGAFLKWLHDKAWDHYYLNTTLDNYPTAERLAFDVAALAKIKLEPALPEKAWVSLVRVYEEYVDPKSWAELRFGGAGWTPLT